MAKDSEQTGKEAAEADKNAADKHAAHEATKTAEQAQEKADK